MGSERGERGLVSAISPATGGPQLQLFGQHPPQPLHSVVAACDREGDKHSKAATRRKRGIREGETVG